MSIPVAAGRPALEGVELDAARAALAPRLRSGDLTALVDLFALDGIRMEWLD